MFNTFVVALVPFKSRCYFLKFIYHVKNVGQVSPSTGKRTYLTYFLKPWYRVYTARMSTSGRQGTKNIQYSRDK